MIAIKQIVVTTEN